MFKHVRIPLYSFVFFVYTARILFFLSPTLFSFSVSMKNHRPCLPKKMTRLATFGVFHVYVVLELETDETPEEKGMSRGL